ncbi:hypothetical protein [Siphonobacter sp. SORGH_AS_0500]|uniref:hypothetical protein n=1 Tax=Siphonobacter sp. SORGH_AS_0500 TaxID=1864824 RepID=UPI00285DD1F8|nr:hypothetical protein [Siphonobacter sp. SORGH_AS_0500]MDR6193721.1 hypothetical protein [Siphonobacter sp. SORGH_AS_0500]
MMRIQLFIAGLILWLHISICNVWSQNNIPRPPVTLPSPNVASLGQYGNYPVSYFTGVPQITIPLYELQEKNLQVPISLSYHASGFRPDQHPGWVGLGWSLQAGGVITRQVNDLTDEYDNPNFYRREKAGYYYNSSVLNRSDWNQTSYLQTIARDVNLWLKDTEPDEFSFSLPNGTSGKFYVRIQGNGR